MRLERADRWIRQRRLPVLVQHLYAEHRHAGDEAVS
jgi:hypothetical protein